MQDILQILANQPAAIIALVVGYILLVVEMYVPGFGVPGILGVLLAVFGLAILGAEPVEILIIVAVYVALLCIALAICLHSAANGRFAKSKLVLNDVATHADTPETNDLSYFIGKTGVVSSTLRPAGNAEFDGVNLNVEADGRFLDVGARVKVTRVEGKRIYVQPEQ